MKRLLLTLLAALALPTAVNAEYLIDLINDSKNIHKNDGKNIQKIDTHSLDRRGDWVHANIYTQDYKNKKVRSKLVRMKINCKRSILEFNWGVLTLSRQKNGLWKERWKELSPFPSKDAKQFEIPGSVIYQETAEGVYKMLCKRGE